jgi:hypothetical protein
MVAPAWQLLLLLLLLRLPMLLPLSLNMLQSRIQTLDTATWFSGLQYVGNLLK